MSLKALVYQSSAISLIMIILFSFEIHFHEANSYSPYFIHALSTIVTIIHENNIFVYYILILKTLIIYVYLRQIVLFFRHCHILSFFFTFGYLIFFRMTTYFGIPYPPNHTNLIQMMVTLKVCCNALILLDI